MVEIFEDIRKIYDFEMPVTELEKYIEFYSESSMEKASNYFSNQPFQVKMFASWTPTIWINLGPAYTMELDKKSVPIKKNQDIMVLRAGTMARNIHSSDRIFTIKFFPGALSNLFGISQALITYSITDAATFIPSPVIQQLKAAISFQDRVAIIQAFLLSRTTIKQPGDYYLKMVRDSIDYQIAGGLKYNSSELAEKMFITSKSLNRYFNRSIGVSPKKYFSSLRARSALAAYIINKQAFDPSSHGYYDMSHFYKDCRIFTGQPLSVLA